MFLDLDWQIMVGNYALALVESVEVHKSVDLLADTCSIKLPGAAYGKAYRVEEQLKRGDKVSVRLGYNGDLVTEFEGYLLNISTDGGSLTINCEDELFLLRKAVADKQFKAASVKSIAEYLVQQAGAGLTVSCTLGVTYDKFVISKATAFDVLKKLQEETKANIYLRAGVLHIHPPYVEQHGNVSYSFQQNIESSDLKYIRKEDKKIEIIITATGADGKKKEVRFGNTGGDQQAFDGHGMSDASMKALAEDKYRVLMTDGYEGSITAWLIPFVEPGYSASVKDEDYEYKDGSYYTTAVTTTFDSNGGARKVQLGIKLGGNG
jgi:hypothetical protein